MFRLEYTLDADATLKQLRDEAMAAHQHRRAAKNSKSSKQEGLYKQVVKTLKLLSENPRHPGLCTHEYSSIKHPYRASDKVFEAYVQNNTPGAYRIFWCYGPNKRDITIIFITPHP